MRGRIIRLAQYTVSCNGCGHIIGIKWWPGQKPKHRNAGLRAKRWERKWGRWHCPGCKYEVILPHGDPG